MNGRVSSMQTMGTLDGPGIRFVLFMQGCKLRCGYCHNPDTWSLEGGEGTSVSDIMKKILRYKAYFGKDGGVTVSGGEPLLQAGFVAELFAECKANGIHTALDTAGSVWNDDVRLLLGLTDMCLLDYKMPNDEDYKKYTGCSLHTVLSFLDKLQERHIDTWIRCVIVNGINDTEENVRALVKTANENSCVKRIELLPFHKMCTTKYEEMGIKFRFGDIDETSHETIEKLNKFIPENLK